MDKWRNRLISVNRISLVAGGVTGVGLWMAFKTNLPPQVPLWYSKPWGENQLASPVWLLVIPAITVMTGVFSELLIRKIKLETVLGLMVLTGSVIVQLIMMFGLVRIMWVIL